LAKELFHFGSWLEELPEESPAEPRQVSEFQQKPLDLVQVLFGM
jgi:hypothetical protein